MWVSIFDVNQKNLFQQPKKKLFWQAKNRLFQQARILLCMWLDTSSAMFHFFCYVKHFFDLCPLLRRHKEQAFPHACGRDHDFDAPPGLPNRLFPFHSFSCSTIMSSSQSRMTSKIMLRLFFTQRNSDVKSSSTRFLHSTEMLFFRNNNVISPAWVITILHFTCVPFHTTTMWICHLNVLPFLRISPRASIPLIPQSNTPTWSCAWLIVNFQPFSSSLCHNNALTHDRADF